MHVMSENTVPEGKSSQSSLLDRQGKRVKDGGGLKESFVGISRRSLER